MTTFVRIVGVRFRRAGKVYYFNPGELPLLRGDQVVVETAAGLSFGDVVVEPKEVPEDEVVQPIRRVVRKVGRDDHERLVENRRDERDAFDIALERIESHGLPMRLVNAEYTFDRNRLTFFFTADNRVDFRALVHDLARRFGVRIELRQIGVRDEAKEIGGVGVCGRELCCTSWMGEFSPVSIRMAKHQNLSLNPAKLTGQCGRLKCCLKFENDTYREVRALLPKVGATVAFGLPATAAVLDESAAVGAEYRLPVAAGAEGRDDVGSGGGPARRDRPGGGRQVVVARGPDGETTLRLADASHVVAEGRVREVLVTWESVDVDIGRGRRVRVSLKQFERGEAVVVPDDAVKVRDKSSARPSPAPPISAAARDGVPPGGGAEESSEDEPPRGEEAPRSRSHRRRRRRPGRRPRRRPKE